MASKKKASTNIAISLSDVERSALSQALDFLLHCEDFSYADSKTTYETVLTTAEKLDINESTLTRGQTRACITAVHESIARLSGDPKGYARIAELYPDLIPDIKESLPVLVQLLPLLRSKLS